MKSHARVVVIGGGAVGTAILYHLALAGVTDTLLVEKDELTLGLDLACRRQHPDLCQQLAGHARRQTTPGASTRIWRAGRRRHHLSPY